MRDDLASKAFELLRRSNVRINSGNLDELSLALPDGTTVVVQVKSYRTPPSPSGIRNLVAHQAADYLLVTPRPTDYLTEAARVGLLNLVTLEPQSVLINRQELFRDSTVERRASPTVRQGRPAWGRYALIRSLLLAHGPMVQTELADCVGISQPAVVKNLRHLDRLVERTSQGWSPTDPVKLLSELLHQYPGPRGAATYWYNLDPLHDQVLEATKYAKEMGAEPLVSGDAAADIYAPWRLPDTAILYIREVVDFSGMGFSPASQEEATLIAVIPEDQTLWRTARRLEREGLPLADPLVTLWDLTLSDSPDAPEAINHLKRAILNGTAA